jgi:8-oxo-dGTP diphosphatase
MERPGVGLNVIIKKDNKVLLGKRTGSHGVGTWNFPGGHLEFNEEFDDCARREVKEETGLAIKNLKQVTFTNDKFIEEGKHYVTLFMVADYESGVAEVKEPEKCEEWQWFEWSKLPGPLFLPGQSLREQGFNPFD